MPASAKKTPSLCRGRAPPLVAARLPQGVRAKTDFQGSRENLHLVERWTRTGPTSLEYVVTIEDPTVWTKAWTVKQEFTRQSDEQNRLYTEPRCIEGNYGFPGIMHGRRAEERAFAAGRGPDPATRDAMK